MRFVVSIIALFSILGLAMANPVTRQLQELLNSGADLVLEKGKVYEIDATLQLKTRGQAIYTGDVTSIRDYAILRVVHPTLVTIINAEGVADVLIRNVRIDGNRHNMRPSAGKVPMEPFISDK